MRKNLAKHLIIGVISATAVVSLVGSISGTFAWYLNSNTAKLSFIGASVYSTQSLEMSLGEDDPYTSNKGESDVQEYAIGGNYVEASLASGPFDANEDYFVLGDEIPAADAEPGPLVYHDEGSGKYYALEYVNEPVAGDLASYYCVTNYGCYNHNGVNFEPVTPGVTMNASSAINGVSMYKMPHLGNFPYSEWADATGQEYLQFPINMRARKVDGQVNPELIEHHVYLTDLTVEATVSDGDLNANDFLEALRIHFHTSTSNVLLSKTAGTINLYGSLDLAHDGDGVNDTMKYASGVYESNPNYNTVGIYGDQTQTATQTTASWVNYAKAEDTGASIVTHGASPVGTTTTLPEAPFQMIVTVWVESWSLLQVSSWTNYAASFNLGMTFSVESMGII